MKALIRAEISIVGPSPDEIACALRVLACKVESSCRLDEPEGKEAIDDDDGTCTTMATIGVLPEYQEGDLEKFIGCSPDATGDLSTEEYLDKVRGRT